MIYGLEQTRRFARTYKKLHDNVAADVDAAALFIATDPKAGEQKNGDLAGTLFKSFADSLKYWEGRFHTITLEDRNLPAIAERRLLKPVDATAKQQIRRRSPAPSVCAKMPFYRGQH